MSLGHQNRFRHLSATITTKEVVICKSKELYIDRGEKPKRFPFHPYNNQGQVGMGETEHSIAVSYYQFFRSRKVDDARTSGADQAPPKGAADSEEQSIDFWVEASWGDEDELNAQAILEKNREKCSISPWSTVEKDVDAWNQFYRDHGTKFFKDRHYLEKAFPLEFSPQYSVKANKTLVEIGCGVGNALLPLLESTNGQWRILHGLDLSSVAIDLVRKDPRFLAYNNNQQSDGGATAFAHVCDISAGLPPECVGVADVTTLLFCLSAVDPDDMAQAAQNVAMSLRPGGILVFRDYGRYDEAQMKLGISRSKKLKDNFYRKHDGTKCFYFTIDDLERLFKSSGLEVLELKYLRRLYSNKATGETRRRVWVQGRFRRPL